MRIKYSGVLVMVAILAMSLSTTSNLWAQINPLGQQGCARGTVVGGPNLVKNGDFAIDAGPGPGVAPQASFTSQLRNIGPGLYPADPTGGFSIQTGAVVYHDGDIVGRPFPGDSQRDVPPSNTYFYSNPSQDPVTGEPFAGVLWEQTVTGLAPSTTYNFFAYFDNLLTPVNAAAADPNIELMVDTVSVSQVTVTKTPDQWQPIQFSFVTGPQQTSAVLRVQDRTRNQNGDDFAMTQINLKQCVSGLGVAKLAYQPSDNHDGTHNVTYLITLRNYGVDHLGLTNLQAQDNLGQTFANSGGFAVVSLSSSTLNVNPGFNGMSDINMLAPGNSLGPQSSAIIELVVRVSAGSGPGGTGPFDNNVSARALAGTIEVQDNSVPGLNPDVDGNSNPKDIYEDQPTRVFLTTTKAYLPLIQN